MTADRAVQGDPAFFDLVSRLRAEAIRTDERRGVVLAGDRDAGIDAAFTAVDAANVDDGDVTIVSTREGFRFDRVSPRRSRELLGTTREVVILDCHGRFRPNTLGQVLGAVDGGGLLVLLTPDLDDWPGIHDGFDEGLAVPPYTIDDVTGRFRRRLIGALREHEGIAIASVREGEETNGPPEVRVRVRGLTESTERRGGSAQTSMRSSANDAFPDLVYDSCLTRDQVRAVRALESLRGPTANAAVVLESDRGRGKSSAAGLAAAALAAAGERVLVTAPETSNVSSLFDRVREALTGLEAVETVDEDGRRFETDAGGAVEYVSPETAAASVDGRGTTRHTEGVQHTERMRDETDRSRSDALIVDEAAALPVATLERLLSADAVAFATTIHGYEGAGRGFSVRFRDRLREAEREEDRTVRDVRLEEPIRYARGDPIERFGFHALLLDAAPAPEPAIDDLRIEDEGRSDQELSTGVAVGEPLDGSPIEYRSLEPEALLADEQLLSEAFGLLVFAHYRTEPNDLARLLDAPNLSVRALMARGHVLAVALLAREGGLDPERRASMYEGSRVRGNMIPDVLTSQLRDEEAGRPVGLRTMRIATHPALRGRGLGSRLLDRIHAEFAATGDQRGVDGETGGALEDEGAVDYFGVSYGATPRLVRFWRRAGYSTVHVSATRNAASGEHSAVMLRPASQAGEGLLARHADALADRARDGLSDALRAVDPDVIRACLGACSASRSGELDLSGREWRAAAAAAVGPGTYDAAPGAIRDLAVAYLLRGTDGELSAREEQVLVAKALQGHPAERVAEDLGFESERACMRTLGSAIDGLLDVYGGDVADAERARFEG
jgi:tRNA(Met) cytidine acetyltransferase